WGPTLSWSPGRPCSRRARGRRARPGRPLVLSWPGAGGRARDPHAGAAGERVRWRDDDLVGRLQAGGDLHGGAIVAPDRDRNELRPAVLDHRDLESFGAEEQRVGGNRGRRDLLGKLEVNEDVGAGQQLSAW